jgi:outer membrane protein insertion porin family
VRYTLRQDEILDVDQDASPYIKQEEGDEVLTSQVGWTFLYDVRDQRFLPNEGYVIRLDQDFAGLGGDSKFFRNELRAEYFYSLFTDVVLDLSASGGYIFGWGGDDVRLANRFFLGGSSLRGFQFAGIGPRDERTDDALGGNLYYVGSAEIRFPIGLPEELRVFGRAFVDAGTLTQIDLSGPGLVDSGNLRVGAGVGLSWLSPFGPLAIDVAQAVVKDDLDQTETFRVSFGTRF